MFDPGNFAPEGEHAQLLDGADYLLITHEHPDHFDADRVLPLIAEKPQLRIWAPQAVAEKILDTHQTPTSLLYRQIANFRCPVLMYRPLAVSTR